MQILMLLNGLGVIIAAAFAGLLMARGLFPLRGTIAGVLFLFAAFFPFFHEYGIIRRGFQRLENDLLGKLRRRFQPKPGVTPWEWSSFIERVWRILDLTEGGQNEP